MKRIRLSCKQLSPLLMNPMTDAVLNSLITGVRDPINKERPFADVAAERVFRSPDGKIGIPTINLIGALKYAGRNVKNGKKAISTAASTTLFSFMQFPTDFVVFDGQEEKEAPWIVDKRRGVMNGPKPVAVGIIRPRFDVWGFTTEVLVNEKICKEDTAKRLFDEAGSNAGLCDFRPNKNGPFGRFRVSAWDVEEYTEEVLAEAA